MSSPEVTVLMTVYDGERFLDESVRSICAQTFRDFEFLIINDGSRDGTGALLDAHAAKDTRIRVVHQDHFGRVASLNRGVGEAKGRLLALMDCDDIALPERFSLQVERFHAEADLGVLGGHIRSIDAQGRFTSDYPIRYPIGADVAGILYYGAPVAQPAVMMRLDLVKTVGGYRPFFIHSEDYDLWLRLSEVTRIDNIDRVLLHYRWHGGNVSLRFKETQITGTFLAQAAWMMRRLNFPDPVDSWPAVDSALLFDVPLPDREKKELVTRWVRAEVINQPDSEFMEGERLIAVAQGLPGFSGYEQKRDVAKAHGKLARSAYRMGFYGRALRHGVAAFEYAPAWMMREIARRFF